MLKSSDGHPSLILISMRDRDEILNSRRASNCLQLLPLSSLSLGENERNGKAAFR